MATDEEAIQSVTPREVAEWMAAELAEHEILRQQPTAYEIKEKFGEEFVCPDADGDLGIARKVLYQFRKLNDGSVVWVAVPGDKLGGYWRPRESQDGYGRKQTLF